ncbi:MAG: thioredoxin-like domain-containing protein [Cytophagales bacterium]|nr:thioredoxin-like domain-containing protein [Cytophagales bacterium]
MKNVFLLCICLLPLFSAAQDGYKINFTIKELKDTTVYLGYYYGESTFLKDTARSDSRGRFTFDGSKKLDRGMYFLVLGKTKVFEPGFMVNQQQRFSMETSTEDYVRQMKVTGDTDNQLFFENMTYNADRHKEAAPFIKILQDSTLNEDQKKEARASFAEIDKKVQAHQQDLFTKYPSSLTVKLMNVNRQIQIPEPPKKSDGSIDSSFQLRYYRQHFFDYFELADEAMIRLPTALYQDKLNDYLDKLFLQTPDSLMNAIDGLAARVKSNQETYKYLVWTCVYKYQKPAIMGLDEVYVRLYDKYYASGEMDFWITPSLKKNLKDHADKLRNSLIGKIGTNLIMQDQALQRRALYDLKQKYTILYIFDPDCGHCREESPKLVDLYMKQKAKFNFEVFAVSLDTSIQKMKNYIKDMKMTWTTVNGPRSYVGPVHNFYYAETTPMIYVLDEKKKIIAKGLPVDRLEEFFTNYERMLQRTKSQKAKGT